MVCGVETTAFQQPQSLFSSSYLSYEFILFQSYFICFLQYFQMHKSSLGKATRLHQPYAARRSPAAGKRCRKFPSLYCFRCICVVGSLCSHQQSNTLLYIRRKLICISLEIFYGWLTCDGYTLYFLLIVPQQRIMSKNNL